MKKLNILYRPTWPQILGVMFALVIEPDLFWYPFNAVRNLLNGFGVI
jgi:hypothetical protein